MLNCSSACNKCTLVHVVYATGNLISSIIHCIPLLIFLYTVLFSILKQGLVTAACSLLEELAHTHHNEFKSCAPEAIQRLSSVSD